MIADFPLSGVGLNMFQLRDDDHRFVRTLAVLRPADAPVITRPSRAKAADTRWWIEAGGNGLARFLGVTNHRDDHSCSAEIEHGFDQHRVVPRDADQRSGLAAARRDDVRLDRLERKRIVLHLDPHEIEICAYGFGYSWVREGDAGA